MLKKIISTILILLFYSILLGEELLKMETGLTIRKKAIIDTTTQKVWEAITTIRGAKSFFAPEADIELAVGGKYELYFAPKEPEGKRGSEGCKILAFLPEEMLAFTWNNPPHLSSIRDQHTWVVITLKALQNNRTEVVLTHIGWKEGEEWIKAFQYFTKAWEVVLGKLQKKYNKPTK